MTNNLHKYNKQDGTLVKLIKELKIITHRYENGEISTRIMAACLEMVAHDLDIYFKEEEVSNHER